MPYAELPIKINQKKKLYKTFSRFTNIKYISFPQKKNKSFNSNNTLKLNNKK